MTLLSALRATKVLGLAVVLVAGGMTAADARDGWDTRHHGHHNRFKKLPSLELDSHGGRLRTELHYSESNRQFRQENRSFYSNAITAYRSFGDSIYIYIDDNRVIDWGDRPARHRKVEPKVITVIPGQNNCSWEAGVCVIRPQW